MAVGLALSIAFRSAAVAVSIFFFAILGVPIFQTLVMIGLMVAVMVGFMFAATFAAVLARLISATIGTSRFASVRRAVVSRYRI